MDESRPIKVSFSFYPADVTALAARVSELKKAGVMVRSATVLRALVYLTPTSEMFAHAVRLAGAQALLGAAYEKGSVTDHPTVDLPKEDIR